MNLNKQFKKHGLWKREKEEIKNIVKKQTNRKWWCKKDFLFYAQTNVNSDEDWHAMKEEK